MNNPMILANVKEDFYLNFIKDDRYLWLLDGLKTTLIITVFAVIVGLIIGFLVAIIRSAHDKSGSFKILNAICRVYLTVIRGTPTMIQLLIMNFVIFGAVSINKIIVGGLAFGPAGPIGPTGAAGPAGPTGATGATGPAGTVAPAAAVADATGQTDIVTQFNQLLANLRAAGLLAA